MHALEGQHRRVAYGRGDLELAGERRRVARGRPDVEPDPPVEAAARPHAHAPSRVEEDHTVAEHGGELREDAEQVRALDDEADVVGWWGEGIDERLDREDGRLVLVGNAVPIRVLIAVGDAVPVAVGVVGIGAEEHLLDVIEAVVVLVEGGRRTADAPRAGAARREGAE